MKFEKKCIGLFAASIVIASFFSCHLTPYVENSEPLTPDSTKIIEASSLFSPAEDEEKESVVFETNDTRYITKNGCTLWSVKYENASNDFEPIDMTLNKEYGNSNAGFGIVFCSQMVEEKPFMLTVLISMSGSYCIGKVTDGVFEYIQEWKSSSYLRKGRGVNNRISIDFEPQTRRFLLKINNNVQTTFAVTESIAFKDSRYGYAVVISDAEQFPFSSVKVSFAREN